MSITSGLPAWFKVDKFKSNLFCHLLYLNAFYEFVLTFNQSHKPFKRF